MMPDRREQRRLHGACIRKHLDGIAFSARGFWRACRPDGLCCTAFAFLALALVCLACVFFVGCSKKEPPPDVMQTLETRMEGARRMVHLRGTSMLPALPVDWWAEMRHTHFDDLREGDVVLFWSDTLQSYVCHRLMRKAPLADCWFAKGDNNPRYDADAVTRRNYACRIEEPAK